MSSLDITIFDNIAKNYRVLNNSYKKLYDYDYYCYSRIKDSFNEIDQIIISNNLFSVLYDSKINSLLDKEFYNLNTSSSTILNNDKLVLDIFKNHYTIIYILKLWLQFTLNYFNSIEFFHSYIYFYQNNKDSLKELNLLSFDINSYSKKKYINNSNDLNYIFSPKSIFLDFNSIHSQLLLPLFTENSNNLLKAFNILNKSIYRPLNYFIYFTNTSQYHTNNKIINTTNSIINFLNKRLFNKSINLSLFDNNYLILSNSSLFKFTINLISSIMNTYSKLRHYIYNNKDIYIIVSEFNQDLTLRIYMLIYFKLIQKVSNKNIKIKVVQGSVEIISGIRYIVGKYKNPNIICIGVIIDGETHHSHYISNSIFEQINYFSRKSNIINGILLTKNKKQAVNRLIGHSNAISDIINDMLL